MLNSFEPDQTALSLLGAEHENGTWVGRELLPIANRIRNQGGSQDDYERWVLSSTLWTSYKYSTSDPVSMQRKHLESAWDKSEESKPFDLEESLSELSARVATARWTGRSGSRNRAVALAFIGFCIEHNCFTRTISSYELSKHTAGMSHHSVHRALVDLVNLGLLTKVERTDRRPSTRSTSRYQVNLRWKPERSGSALLGRDRSTPVPLSIPGGNSGTEIRSTGKLSLSQIRRNRDLWSSRGLGPTAGRVWEVLADKPATVRELSARAGLSDQATRRAVAKLADHCLAGTLPGRPAKYFLVETPLSAVEDALGCTGYVEHVIAKTTRRQAANRAGYPSNYTQKATTE